MKRDDLTGFGLSGNKVRKLDFLLADALAQGADVVITCGGAQSNHCRATAVAARQLGLEPWLLLRGAQGAPVDGNLLLDHLLGARVESCTADAYRDRRTELMETLAAEAVAAGRTPYIIPEGGSNALGSRGFTEAAKELVAQLDEPVDSVVVAVGSGGTVAGLALANPPWRTVGVAVCDDRPTFVGIVEGIAREAGLALPEAGGRWDILEGFQGPGYGIPTGQTWEALRRCARLEGLLLDPVYTGKAMAALLALAPTGALGKRVVFWHTGGTFGLMGRELPA